jgi:signal transduction histidine kinase
MAAGLAHEVNNPLTAVMGFAYLLQQNPATPPEIREDVESIYRESKRAADVIKSFLAFSRGQAAEKKAEEINGLVENVLKLRQSRMQKENISVNLDLAEGLPSVYCDGSQIQQAMLNIILNAEYFMYQTHQQGTLVISTRLCGGNIRLSIADDGPGITPDNLDHVFDPFYTTKQVGEGTGLGLSICHSIVRGHGGNIYVESSPGKGAIFTIELPAGQQGFMLSQVGN